jgi:outer membrane protein TolC
MVGFIFEVRSNCSDSTGWLKGPRGSYAKRLSVLSDLQNQIIALRTTGRVLKLYSDGLIPQAEETLISGTAAYRVGKVDFQTLLSAVIDVLRTKQEYFRALADHEIAVAKIRQTIGEQP